MMHIHVIVFNKFDGYLVASKLKFSIGYVKVAPFPRDLGFHALLKLPAKLLLYVTFNM